MSDFYDHCERYTQRLGRGLLCLDWTHVHKLAAALRRCQKDGSTVYLAGNGGSASNAEHIANDLQLCSVRAVALSANGAVMSCIANDCGFDSVFMMQLAVMANPASDVLVALSGSGNSPNILRALEHAGRVEMEAYAILGFDGGHARRLVAHPIHVPMDDQQVCEDIQLTCFHVIMQSLRKGDA